MRKSLPVVGVVGLLPRQTNVIRQEYERKLDLRFLSREGEKNSISSFANKMPVVVLMTKFIFHSIFDSVPQQKRLLVAGGLSDLRRTLDKLVSPEPETATTVATNPEPLSEEKPDMSHPTQPAYETDLKLLQYAQIGDVFVSDLPHGMSPEGWRRTIASVRTYRKRTNGVVTKVEYPSSTRALITVTEICDVAAPSPKTKPSKTTEPVKKNDPSSAAVWVNYANFRAMSGKPFDTIIKEADEFLSEFNKRFI